MPSTVGMVSHDVALGTAASMVPVSAVLALAGSPHDFSTAAALPARAQIVNIDVGGLLVSAVSVFVCVSLIVWFWRSKRADRRAMLVSAALLTILIVAIHVEGTRFRWWGGAFVHELPLAMQVVVLAPIAFLGWLTWLGSYTWIVRRIRHPRLTYVLVGAVIILASAAADRAELGRGIIEVGDGRVWINAVALMAIMLAPLLLYDMIREVLERELLP